MGDRSSLRGIMLLIFWLTLTACVREALGVDSAASELVTSRKSSLTSVFSLFNMKSRSKFWSETVMHDGFEDLERPGVASSKAALENFTKAVSIADYLKLSLVESIYLPVPINFIFIGFEGNGNRGLKLGREELERWFTQIDHVLEHTRVPQLGEALTPFYKQRADGEKRHHLPFVSYSHYNYSVHAIEMEEKVTDVFERALQVFSRNDDFNDSRPSSEILWQVDVDNMSYLFTSLVHYLDLDNAYNIFIMNPKWDVSRGHYGYRRGLSDAEIKLLKEDADIRSVLLKSRAEHVTNPLDMGKLKRPLYERHPMIRFAWTTVETHETASWVDASLDALNTIEHALQGKTRSELVIANAQQIMYGKSDDIASALWQLLKTEQNPGLQSECLVDTWVGNERWAFIDLTAGPFTWGPAVGGDGIRTELTLPAVENMFKNISDDIQEISEEAAEQALQNMVHDRFSLFEGGDQTAIDTLLAEIDIYELFSDKHCKGRNVKLALCEELQERMGDLKEELQAFQNADYDETLLKKAEHALKRIERWNLFSDVHESQHGYNFSISRDWFLAHLAATLWSSMKHIVTPSTADGAFHFYERIYFQIYFITQEKVKHINLLPVNVSAVKEALSTLTMPSQKKEFGVRMLPFSEDYALSMAFSVARRAATVPVLLVNGTYKITTRLYIDSLILQHQLQHLSETQPLYGRGLHGRSVLEVPIFWFIQGETLLIDKHYAAKALPDIVIVVQSSESSWESHLQCNGNSILWDLSRPLKHAVAATAEHLSGLVPTHISYSKAHDNAVEDWTWSTGCHPFSSTSSGWHLSLFQSDAILRSYIITALDESIQLVNRVIELLVFEQTYKEAFATFRKHELLLLNNYNSIISIWKRIAGHMENLHYNEAARLLLYIEDESLRLMKVTNDTLFDLHPITCTRQRMLKVGYGTISGIGVVVVGILVWLLLRPRRVKPKIN